MNQKIVVSLLAVLLMPGASAFAQFKNPVKAAKNFTNLSRVVLNKAQRPYTMESWVPARFVATQKIELNSLQTPKRITPVTASLVAKAGYKATRQDMHDLGMKFIVGQHGETASGKAFYEDQSQLARDLDAFYKGNADTFISPDGRNVKLYALPVDGILYKPAGYATPLVLNSKEYFVIYDVKAKTGRIADNNPEVYNLFKLSLQDEIWKAMGQDKVFDDLNNFCDAILLAHLHQARLAQLRTEGSGQDVATLVKEGKGKVYKKLNNSHELLGYLKSLPKVRQQGTQFAAYVVELPVEGLVWVDSSGDKHAYNSKDHVMLFFELGAVGVFPRADVENPELFVPVKKTPQNTSSEQFLTHPQSPQWVWYETEKKAWSRDREQHVFESLWAYYPHYFASQKELGRFLHSFHHHELLRVYDKNTHRISFVYEIPVEGLTIGYNTTAIDPETYVFLYDQETGGQLIKRADLENAALYEFVK